MGQVSRLPLFERMAATKSVDSTLDDVLASIQLEVQGLLNTRLSTPVGKLTEQPRTIATYGIPDLPHFSGLSFGTWGELCAHIADTITAFEPRLTAVQVTARKTDQSSDGLDLDIMADLRRRPEIGPVSFAVRIPAGGT